MYSYVKNQFNIKERAKSIQFKTKSAHRFYAGKAARKLWKDIFEIDYL